MARRAASCLLLLAAATARRPTPIHFNALRGGADDFDEKVGAADDVNEARRSFLNHFFAAVRRARANVDERVYVQAASKAQIEKLKAMLVERGLWDNQKCKA